MTTTTVDGFSTSFTAVVGDFRRFLENESRNGTSSLDDETTVFNESPNVWSSVERVEQVMNGFIF